MCKTFLYCFIFLPTNIYSPTRTCLAQCRWHVLSEKFKEDAIIPCFVIYQMFIHPFRPNDSLKKKVGILRPHASPVMHTLVFVSFFFFFYWPHHRHCFSYFFFFRNTYTHTCVLLSIVMSRRFVRKGECVGFYYRGYQWRTYVTWFYDWVLDDIKTIGFLFIFCDFLKKIFFKRFDLSF